MGWLELLMEILIGPYTYMVKIICFFIECIEILDNF